MSVLRYPRWFRFGKGCVIDVKEQAKIGRELTGSMPIDETGALLSEGITRATSCRRKELHHKLYGRAGGIVFRTSMRMFQSLHTDTLNCGSK